MGDCRRSFLSDEEKKRVLNDLRNTLKIGTNGTKLAESVTKITSNVEHLVMSAKTTADLSFSVNVVDTTVDCVATHLESNDPHRELFNELVIADEVSMLSWCPGGYEQLEEITKSCIPLRLGFEKFVALQDLVARRGEQIEAPVKEKKKRVVSQLSKAPVSAPKKVTCTDTIPTHQIHMEIVSNKLKDITSEKGPINFFKFVVNPRSFVQTVYNVFIVSFLVHEDHALLSIVDNEELQIQFNSHRDRESNVEVESTIQLIQSMSPSEWMALVKCLKIKSSLLPELCPKDSQYFQNIVDVSSGNIFLDP